MAIPTLGGSALGIQNVPMMTPDIQGQPLTEVKPKTIATGKPITLPKKLPATGGKMNVEEFAQKIKAKYPQYESLDNADLAKKMIDKYPQYGEQVDMTTFGKISEVTPMQGGIRRGVAGNASLEGTMLEGLEPVNKQLDRVNLVGRFTQFIDDNVQKIPTISRESMAQALKGTPFEGMEVLPTMVANAPGSLLKTATATARGITNPFDTIIGLSKLALTEEGRQAIIDRYGSIEGLKKTMTEDPVGLASDALTLVQGGAGLASKGAKIAGMTDTASKLGNISNVAGGAADLGLSTVIPQGLQKASQFGNEMGQKGLLGTVGNTVIKGLVEPTQPLQAIKGLIPDTTKARNYAAEKLMNSKLKITKTNKDAVRKASGIEPSQYILENDLGGNTIDDIVANTQDFVDRSMATKLQALETVKTPQEITSRERLIGNSIISQAKNDISEVYGKPFDDILPDEIVPELQDQFNMIQNVDNLIKGTEALPIQLEAMKSLYDSYNSHLKYDPSKKRILSSAEKIRLGLQSNIEGIGKEVGVDIKRLNKNIAGGKALEKGLIQSMDRADNNNIFGLSDTQTALISSVLGGSPVDVALTLGGKSILENVGVRSNIAKSLYTKQFDEQRLVSKDSIVGSDNTAGGNISRQFANSNTSVNSSKSSDINQPSQTLPPSTKAPLVQSTKTAPKLPVAKKTPLKQASESVNVAPKKVQALQALDATNPKQELMNRVIDNEQAVRKVIEETNPTLPKVKIDDFIERAKQGRAGTDEMVKEILKKLDTPKLSPKTPKVLKVPTPLSKVDDALPVGEKMGNTTQSAKSLESADLTTSIKKAKAEGKTFEDFADDVYTKRYLQGTTTPSKEFEKLAKEKLRTERDKLDNAGLPALGKTTSKVDDGLIAEASKKYLINGKAHTLENIKASGVYKSIIESLNNLGVKGWTDDDIIAMLKKTQKPNTTNADRNRAITEIENKYPRNIKPGKDDLPF